MLAIESALRNSHMTIDRMFADVELADEDDDRHRRFLALRDALKAGMSFEERMLYPALAQMRGAAAFVVKVALGDHFEIALLIDRADQAGAGSPEFPEMLFDLREAVSEHVRREEEEILGFVAGTFDTIESDRLARGHEAQLARCGFSGWV